MAKTAGKAVSEARRRKPWVALLLGIVSPPIAFVYVGRPVWAALYVVLPIAVLAACGRSGFIFLPAGWATTIALVLVPLLAGIFVPALVARRAGDAYVLRPYNRWYVYLAIGAAGMLAAPNYIQHRGEWFGFESYRIPAGAMQNTVQIGDFILTDTRDPVNLRRGDIVTYKSPNAHMFIKRVVALPGETVAIAGCKAIINGNLLQEAYLLPMSDDASHKEICDRAPVTLANSEIYVLGDNRLGSDDSRRTGPVPLSQVTGIARLIWYARDYSRIGIRLGR